MFNSVDTLSACVRIATGIISTIKINPERMRAGLSADMLATDLAEYLVRKGTFFKTFAEPYNCIRMLRDILVGAAYIAC